MLGSILSISFLGSFVFAEKAPLTLMDSVEYPKAKCLDGTTAGYYYSEATDSKDKLKWVIYLNGGGECDQKESCESQLNGALGSSKYFNQESDMSGWYLASDYCPYNPGRCTWNHVMDPYCTQDLHSGQVTEPTDDQWGLYFSGHHVFTAMLDEMDKKENSLLDATDIILSGTSAGGIGVWMNVDYVAQRYPNARVTAATIAGFYFYATYYDGVNHTDPGGMADFREIAWPSTYALYDAYVDEDCKAAHEENPSVCMIANQSYPFIQSDSFVIQSQTDSVVLTGHDTWPSDYMYETPEQQFMHEWHQNMTIGLSPLMNPFNKKSGVFAAACYTHGGFSHSGPFIKDMNFYDAFDYFYDNRSNPSHYKLSDTCGEMCNPTCME